MFFGMTLRGAGRDSGFEMTTPAGVEVIPGIAADVVLVPEGVVILVG
jgi:hypothetical protein